MRATKVSSRPMTKPSITEPTPDFPMAIVSGDGSASLLTSENPEVFGLFRKHGAVLMRGFEADVDSFGDFARTFCPVPIFNESGKRVLLDQSGAVQSVNLGYKPFPLHPELSREPWRPDVAFFYCSAPPAQGGQTTVCDGAEIVRRLPADMREAMRGCRIRYAVPATPADLQYWLGRPDPDPATMLAPPPHCPFTFEYRGGMLTRCFTRPLLQRTRFQGELAWGNFLLFARYLRGVKTYPLLDDWSPVPDDWVEAVKHISDALTVPVGWQEGDVLMLDNSRFMHGRTQVVPGSDRMIATYFGYLADAEPDPEEPASPPWRSPGFAPPQFGMRNA